MDVSDILWCICRLGQTPLSVSRCARYFWADTLQCLRLCSLHRVFSYACCAKPRAQATALIDAVRVRNLHYKQCSIPFASWPIANFLLLFFANTFGDCGIQYAGLVHQDSFYLVGGTTDPDMNPNSRDDVRILDFATQRWTLVTTDVRPRGRVDQFLIGCGDQLIQFGGVSHDKSSSVYCTPHVALTTSSNSLSLLYTCNTDLRDTPHGHDCMPLLAGYDSAAHEFVEASEALWTFDTKSHRWQQQHPSGPLPVPYLARGLAHFNGRAFLLADDPTMQMGMEVYELDVQDWQWRLLPCHGPAPSCRDRLTSVVFQVQTLDEPFVEPP